MPTVDTRPGKLDVVVRPSNALALNLTFPSVLTGRTFTADTDGTPLTVSVVGAVITVAFSAAVTAALTGRPTWKLVETTAGTQTLITGRVLPSLAGTESQDLDVTVSTTAAAVTVFAGPVGLGDGSVTTAKIVDGAVTASKVAADVATQAELDAVSAGAVTLTTAQTITGLKTVSPSGAAALGLAVKGVASQTADLQQWQNSAGTVLAKVSAGGLGTFTMTSLLRTLELGAVDSAGAGFRTVRVPN